MGASKPLAKKQHLLTLPIYPAPNLQGDNKIIQVTPSLEREPLPREDYILVPTLV